MGRGFGIEVAQQMPTAVQAGPIQRGSGGRSASAVIHMCKRGPRGAVCTPRASGTGLDWSRPGTAHLARVSLPVITTPAADPPAEGFGGERFEV